MPTNRPRHLLTGTDELAAAIDAAAPLYPGESRAAILRHVIRLWSDAIVEQRTRHRAVVDARAGRYPGLYTTRHLDELREALPD